jgi:hypothetical protein
MSGIKGLILAVGLAIAGAISNYAYLASRSQDLETVRFIGIKPEVTVNRGDRLQEDQLQEVSIARANAGNLVKFAEPYESLRSVVGCPVYRTLEGGSLLLRTDTKTPPAELIFGDQTQPGVEEVAMGVPIDSARIVPSLIKPGDLVSFIAVKGISREPTPAPAAVAASGAAALVPTAAESEAFASGRQIERIGPFRVLSLGTRLGSSDVARAARQNTVQENVMMVGVRIENGRFEAKALRLLELMEQSGSRPLGYVLHAPPQKGA